MPPGRSILAKSCIFPALLTSDYLESHTASEGRVKVVHATGFASYGMFRSVRSHMRGWWRRHGWPWLALIVLCSIPYSAEFLCNEGLPLAPLRPHLHPLFALANPWLKLFVLP